MDDRPVSTTERLMKQIANADIEPPIFKVFVQASDHMEGFEAFVSFRKNDSRLSSFATHGDCPEQALASLYDVLWETLGRCDCCGRVGPVPERDDK